MLQKSDRVTGNLITKVLKQDGVANNEADQLASARLRNPDRSQAKQLFGLPLSESCGRNLIPPFLSAAFQRFFNLLAEETSIIHPASIFMSSNDSHVLSLTKEALEAGVLEVSEIPDKVTLGGLIVLFFDSLPEPLLQDSFQALVATKAITDIEYRDSVWRCILRDIEPLGRAVLAYLFKSLFLKLEDLIPHSLSFMIQHFAPILFRTNKKNPKDAKSPEKEDKTLKRRKSEQLLKEDSAFILNVFCKHMNYFFVTSDTDLVFEKKKGSGALLVESASLDKILWKTIEAEKYYKDPEFVPIVCALHRYFVPGVQILKHYILIYASYHHTTILHWQLEIRRRILHLIKLLLLHNHDYFERPQFQTVLQQFCESSALQDTNNFSLIQLQMNTETLTKDWKRRNTLETEPFNPPPEFFEATEEGFLENPQSVLAAFVQQFTNLQVKLFHNVPYKEFLQRRWESAEKSPNMASVMNQFNLLSCWVQSCILKKTDQQGRATLIEAFIDMINLCIQKYGNFHGAVSIFSALESGPISRLKKSFAALPKAVILAYDKLKESLSFDNNSRAVREAIKAHPQPLPMLGLITKDLFVIEDSSPTILPSGLINIFKLRLIHKTLLFREKLPQKDPPTYDEKLMGFFMKLPVTTTNVKELYDISLVLEPRTTQIQDELKKSTFTIGNFGEKKKSISY